MCSVSKSISSLVCYNILPHVQHISLPWPWSWSTTLQFPVQASFSHLQSILKGKTPNVLELKLTECKRIKKRHFVHHCGLLLLSINLRGGLMSYYYSTTTSRKLQLHPPASYKNQLHYLLEGGEGKTYRHFSMLDKKTPN